MANPRDDCCGTHVHSVPANDRHADHNSPSNANQADESISGSETVVRIMIGDCISDGNGGCQRSRQYGSNCCSSGPQLNDIIEESHHSEADSCCGDGKGKGNEVKPTGCCDDGDDSCCGGGDDKLSLCRSEPESDCCGSAGCCDEQQSEVDSCCGDGKNKDNKDKSAGCCGADDKDDSCCGGGDDKHSLSRSKPEDDCCGSAGCCDERQPKEVQIDSCCSVKKNEDSGCCTSKVVKPDNCCGDATCDPEPTSIQVKPVETTGCCSAKESESKTKCSKTYKPKASNKKSCCSNDDKSSGCRQAPAPVASSSCCSEKKAASTSCCTSSSNKMGQQYVIRQRKPHTRTESSTSSVDTDSVFEEKIKGKQHERRSAVPDNFYGRFFECCCVIGKKLMNEYNLKHGVKQHSHSRHTHAHKHRHGHDHKHKSSRTGVYKEKSKAFVGSTTYLDTLGFLPNDIDLVELGKKQGTQSIKLSIQGMDCPSCATRVNNALATIPSVSNPKVNTFAGFATFDCIMGIVEPDDIAKRVARMTGFGCEVVQEAKSHESSRILNLIVTSIPGSWDDAGLPRGISVKSARSLKSGTYELIVEFDPSVIKPRQVLAAFARWGGILKPTSKVHEATQVDKDVVKLFRKTCISALCCIPVLVFSWAPIPHHPVIYGAISLALTTIIQVYIAAPLYTSAFSAFFYQHVIDMDLLVVMSTTVAYVFSVVAYGLNTAGIDFSDNFFETSALLVTLIILGRLISAYARRRATSALDNVDDLQVDTIDLVNTDGSVETIAAELMHEGDILRVLPESRIPTDGIVVDGSSQVDESSITGEHLPVDKQKGSALTAGTINLSGMLTMSATKLTTDNTIAEISRLMFEAQNARLPIQDLADKAASYLAPVVLVISVITFIIWILVGLLVRNQSSTNAGVAALRYAIAVLVVSCPCAIAICVPMIVVISVAVAAKEGVLFKSVEAVQFARLASAAVFDKTGTLTEGKLSVMESHLLHENAAALVLAISSNSRHPVSEAVTRYLQEKYSDLAKAEVSGIESLAGKGMKASFGTKDLRGGNCAWLKVQDVPLVQNLRNQALTLFAVTLDQELIAVFGLSDSIRPGAEELVRTFEARGTKVYILSGDEQTTVSALASKLGIQPENAIGRCTPQSKQEKVKDLQANGKNKVLFVGDGTNDSIALVQADVGVSMGSGTDIALSAADIVITNPADITHSINTILKVSNGAYKRILVGFGWAGVYNLFAVTLAAGAFVEIRIAPEYAGLGEMVSVLPMVLVAWSMWFSKA